MSQKIPELPEELLAQLGPMIIHRDDLHKITKIPVYCNVCEHEIARHGGDWQCVSKPPCRCLMMGCIPKVWKDAD